MGSPSASRAGWLEVDITLLKGQRGDSIEREQEWLRVFNHFQPRLRGFFATRQSDQMALDDLLAEIWQRALGHIASVRGAEVLWNWLTTIGNNLLKDQRRKSARRVSTKQRFQT